MVQSNDAAEIVSKLVSVDGRYGHIKYFANDPVIGESLRLYGEWAEKEIEFLLNFVPEGGSVLDIGSFIGTHALAFASKVGPDGAVQSFEPQPASYAVLYENCTSNGLKNIVCNNAFVSDSEGNIALEEMEPESHINFGGLSASVTGTKTARMMTVDGLALDRCDFMKIDVEGFEHTVLRGAPVTIQKFKPVIYAEINSLEAAVPSLKILQEYGYACFVHAVDAFNPDNLFGSTENIFGPSRELAIVAVSPERKDELTSKLDPSWEIYPIETIDDLAYAMLQKPQYFDEILRQSVAAQSGGKVCSVLEKDGALNNITDILRNATARYKEQEKAQAAVFQERLNSEVARAESEARVLNDLLNRTRSELQTVRQHKDAEITQLSSELRRIKKSNIYIMFRSVIEWEMKKRERRKGASPSVAKNASQPSAAAANPVAHVGEIILNTKLMGEEPAFKKLDGALMLYVTHASPVLPRAGNEYRIHRVVKWLQSRANNPLMIWCPLHGEEPNEAQLSAFTAEHDNAVVVYRDGTLLYKAADPGLRNVIQSLAGRKAETKAYRLHENNGLKRLNGITATFAHDALVTLILELDHALSPAATFVNYCFLTRFFPALKADNLKIVDTHDVFSTKKDKVARFGIDDGLAITSEEEAALLKRADLLLAIQPEEAKELEALKTGAKVITVGVDMSAPLHTTPRVDAPRMLIVASSNDMNCKGLKDFIRFAWPMVRSAVPNAELDVIGSVGRMLGGHEPGVKWLGLVDDLEPSYQAARLVINPTVAGTGLKIKTLEALSQLRPIVLWPSGIDGLDPALAQYCMVENNWYGFAQAIITALRNDEIVDRVIAARETIYAHLSPNYVYETLGLELDKRFKSGALK